MGDLLFRYFRFLKIVLEMMKDCFSSVTPVRHTQILMNKRVKLLVIPH